MSYNREDNIPFADQGSSVGGPSVINNNNGVKQTKGEFAVNGGQPSFALELDISTIEHGWYGNMMNGLGAIIGGLGS
ncbi:hypothetical protein ABG067_009495, partial [Albugo candida]